jgi:hypothetical protein
MRLFEIDNSDPLVVKLIAVSDQLYTDLLNGETDPDMTTEELLQYLQKYDIVLDKTDLYNMIKKPPLNKIISNIQADKIIFKNINSPEAPDQEQSNQIVKQMANQAVTNMQK